MGYIRTFFLQLKSLSLVEKIGAVVLVAVIVRSLLPLATTGFPATHDGEGHIARIANYAAAVRQGHIPPRIAPTFWNGYGYPIFNFHYPFLSIVGTPLVLAGIHPELALKFWVVVGWLALWSGTFLYTQKITASRAAALLGTLIAALNPYFYSLVYVRGSYGELFATAAAIWLLFFIEQRASHAPKATKNNAGLPPVSLHLGVILTSAVMLLAHNIYAVLLFPCSFLYAFIRRKTIGSLTVVLEFIVGFGLAAFFWIPALLEKKYVRFDEQFSQFYLDHFVEFKQLFSSSVTFGTSVAGGGDTMSLGIGLAGLSVLAAAALYWAFIKLQILEKKSFAKISPQSSQKGIFIAALLAVSSILVMLPVSLFLWKVLFILPYFQFPWRFLGPLSIVLAVLAAVLWNTKNKMLQYIMIGGIVLNLFYFVSWYWPSYNHFAPEYYLNYFQTATIYDEFRPKTFTVEPGTLSPGQPQLQGTGSIHDVKWRGTYRTYVVLATEPVTIVEPTMYFPGWKVWANGKEQTVISESDAAGENLYKGQVAYQLPAGEWQISSKMTQHTPARLIGNTLTMISILVALFVLAQTLWPIFSKKSSY